MLIAKPIQNSCRQFFKGNEHGIVDFLVLCTKLEEYSLGVWGILPIFCHSNSVCNFLQCLPNNHLQLYCYNLFDAMDWMATIFCARDQLHASNIHIEKIHSLPLNCHQSCVKIHITFEQILLGKGMVIKWLNPKVFKRHIVSLFMHKNMYLNYIFPF